MATPQEARFSRIACEETALTKEQIEACKSFQAQKLDQGSTVSLWDCAVLMGLLDQARAEKLADMAGDLPMAKLGDFSILYKLGEGGMGAVYLGMAPDKRRVALKVLSPLLARQRPLLSRFMREAQSCCRLNHPNVVCGISVGEDTGHYFFAMEYVDGEDVDQILRREGPMAPVRATLLIAQVAEGLAYAHEMGIIHRDIKPGNIMVTPDGVAKLADLGLARYMGAEESGLTRTGSAMGTPYYMAPEQATDAKRADARSDIYALGGTWYHMIAGRPPFNGTTPVGLLLMHMKEPLKPLKDVVPNVAPGVSSTIERMMAKDPDDRIQTARELIRIIHEQCMGPGDERASESFRAMDVSLAATQMDPTANRLRPHEMATQFDAGRLASRRRKGLRRMLAFIVGFAVILFIGAVVWHFRAPIGQSISNLFHASAPLPSAAQN